jgi:hypothetical protein
MRNRALRQPVRPSQKNLTVQPSALFWPTFFNKGIYYAPYFFAVLWSLKAFNEPDLWWMLRTGEHILQHGLPMTDSFSLLGEGSSWINVKWGYMVLAYLWSLVTGPEGLPILQALASVGMVYFARRIFLLLSSSKDQTGDYFFLIAAILALAGSEFRMTARPEMVSHLATMIMLYIHIFLFKVDLRNTKALVAIPLVQLAWVNLHEAYAVGLVLTGVFLVFTFFYNLHAKKFGSKEMKLYAASSVLSYLVCAVHPYTWRMWLQPLEIYRQLGANKYTAELYDFRQPLYWLYPSYINLGIVALLLFGAALLFIQRKRMGIVQVLEWLSPGYIIMLGLFVFLSLSAARNIPFLLLASIPVIAILLRSVGYDSLHKSVQRFTYLPRGIFIFLIALYILIVTPTYYTFASKKDVFGLGIDPLKNPVGAAQFIKQQGIRGVAFSDYINSSYLLYALRPQFKSVIDLRDLDIFSASDFDLYFKVINNPEAFQKLDSQYRFDYVVLGRNDHDRLQEFINRDATFEMVYVDPSDAVFVRNDPKFASVLQQHAFLDGKRDLFGYRKKPVQSRVTWINYLIWPFYKPVFEKDLNIDAEAAKYYHAILHYDMCVERASRVLLREPNNREMNLLVAQTYLRWSNYTYRQEDRLARLGSALPYIQRILQKDDKDIEALLSMCYYHLAAGYTDVALDYAKLALEIDPGNFYGLLYLIEGKKLKAQAKPEQKLALLQEALTLVESTIAKNPEQKELIWRKGELLVLLERCAEAEKWMLIEGNMLKTKEQLQRYEQLYAPCIQ